MVIEILNASYLRKNEISLPVTCRYTARRGDLDYQADYK
jgi:hypothetical protein